MDSSDDVMTSISLRQKLRGNEQTARNAAVKIKGHFDGDLFLDVEKLTPMILAAIEKAKESEDLMYRYHNDVRFNRFVQERMAYALEAAQPQRSEPSIDLAPQWVLDRERDEQPPATEQEWTNAYVEELWEKGGSIAVKDAHNAALAKHDEKVLARYADTEADGVVFCGKCGKQL